MTRLRNWRLAPLAAALLAGCSFIPTYERPAAPVPAAYGHPSATEGLPAAQLEWQQFFTDPHLRELITVSLSDNRDLRVAIASVEQARAQYDIRNADRYPTIGAAAAATRQPNTNGNGQQVTLYTAGLALATWELDFFGRVAALSQTALAQFLATEEGRKSAQTILVSAVANTWLAVVADEELLTFTRQTLDTREETFRLTKLRFDNGVSSELDLRQAQSLVESSRAALAQQERQRSLDINALSLLIGRPLPPDYRSGTTMATVLLADVPAGMPSDVIASRPDVRAAEQQLLAANANIGAARAAFFPRITLTASAGRASSQLSGLFDSTGVWAYTVAPQLLLPIFDAGRNQAGLASANATRDIAVAQYERSIQVAFREVSDALAGRLTLLDQLQALINVAEAETVRSRLLQLRYNAGVSSSLDLLDAQRALFTARTAEIQTRLLRLQNQVQLYRALGGGWTDTAVSAR
ncbi:MULTISPECIES: efflux transporter outer membrane subunit [Ramlibacter]|uniref:Efflux transporter outer membrane subunit n=1 Tax=Ramlibacter pinisoli TaxID=2682844 RepID=A0A6N8IT56_9BURK|nr:MULTISPECIES: efflux transporter outer membrane subunit [Ramlibacter]MBA2964404.1 efflux transporter outer membrane subunit [Ramlibacter sp. CGMCC 1.13660]MVQ29370.1 efflux transporter outer membrane subunit [Ramlibacter pinisoli]